VITGYGAVTPLGDSAAESWQAIMDYRRGYRYVDLSANGIHTHFIGQVANEPSLKGFPPRFVGVCRVTRAGAGRRAGSGGDGLCGRSSHGVL
jgi:3-oxoacyl-(acyl-carrier-protein) synthase